MAFLAVCGGFLIANFIRNVLRNHKVFKWGLLDAACGIFSLWAIYHNGYEWIYSLRVIPNQSIVVSHLWPKGEIEIFITQIEDIRVYRSPKGDRQYVRIRRHGRKAIGSTAPIPPANEIEAVFAQLPSVKQLPQKDPDWTVYSVPKTNKD